MPNLNVKKHEMLKNYSQTKHEPNFTRKKYHQNMKPGPDSYINPTLNPQYNSKDAP